MPHDADAQVCDRPDVLVVLGHDATHRIDAAKVPN